MFSESAKAYCIPGPTTVTSTVTTTTRTPHQAPTPPVHAPQSQDQHHSSNGAVYSTPRQGAPIQDPYAKNGNSTHTGAQAPYSSGSRSVDPVQSPRSNVAPAVSHRDDFRSDTRNHDLDHAVMNNGSNDLSRQKSIPRKQIGTTTQASPSPVNPNLPKQRAVHTPQANRSKALPSAPSPYNGQTSRDAASTAPSSSILNRSRPISKGSAAPLSGQDILDRAKTNTYDTSVEERVAPGWLI